jgi:DNA invertase Pin-like site-specific DNA recombinase
MKKVIIYGRISTDEQNIESQLQAVRKYCANQDWTITKEYIDKGISVSKDSRPSLDKLKADCKQALGTRKMSTLVAVFSRDSRYVLATGRLCGILL